ncbi:MAG TPA: hypothetical protein VNT75_30710 [Symbiobacteriaceae bacterium]|nr:hypothetical protein [Symbiobacteriaceae bacterium]
MRKLYTIRENEEDGRLLDALIAAGQSTDETQFENPVCPVCGSSTLLAFTENGDFDVVTWFCLTEKEGDTADAWYLICANMECTWEEQVERVRDPMGATIFDLESAHHEFDEYSGLISRDPPEMLELIEWFREALEGSPNRKLQCFLDEAEWRYSDHLERTRKWIDRVPPGKRVGFHIDGEEFEGTFLTATDEGFMVLTEPGNELKVVRVEEVYACFPRRPDRDDMAPKRGEALKGLLGEKDDKADQKRWIMINCATQYVVIQGYHLQLSLVDRFGQYHVRCWEAAAAAHLGLAQKAENYWEGIFRRSDVESRYDVRRMVRVKGYWVDTYGTSKYQQWPAVRTYDPLIASELGLAADSLYNIWDEEDEPRPLRPSWSGVIPEEEVEERKDVRLYHWPLPEFPLPESC